ncbi:hypothetical protein OIU77_015120 [Salix suchowensis]|uniref:W2 domain-containing protein n=1 Tax=Salix suchowensis TaxID=1278906 RepID=A0ABQ8ZTZ1_9ROSI|nr:hypothetical protein OIU77_015120 [Salix suchowensis]
MASRQILSTWLTLQRLWQGQLLKYFGCELGAQSKFDEKTGTSLVSGSHETSKLAGLLENFIKKYCSEKIDALFEGVAKGFAKEVDKKNYLASAVAEDEKSQLLLLRAIEAFCRRSSSSALKEVALVLKELYDADVLEEEPVATRILRFVSR